MKLKPHLKASSLVNAVFICVIISVFSGCLVLIAHYQNILNKSLYLKQDLISRNDSSFNYFLNNISEIPFNESIDLDVFDDNIISHAEKKSWGFYDILICKTIFKSDTIIKTALIGKNQKTRTKLALFATDYNKPLSLSGETKIIGNIKVPIGRTELAYINGQTGNDVLLSGGQLKSNNKLPKTDKYISLPETQNLISLNSIKENIIVNGFDKVAKVIDFTGTNSIEELTCRGNIVLTSKTNLQISSTSNLTDVLVIAPSVTVKSGFQGNIQIIAKNDVTIESNVSLKYPSSIYIKNDKALVTVTINEKTKLVGGIVIDGNSYAGSLNRQLIIEEDATIVGNVYCYGKTQLKGEIIGSIFTDRFFLKTESSDYENVILNGTVNKDSLPKNFIELPLFNDNINQGKYAIVKAL